MKRLLIGLACSAALLTLAVSPRAQQNIVTLYGCLSGASNCSGSTNNRSVSVNSAGQLLFSNLFTAGTGTQTGKAGVNIYFDNATTGSTGGGGAADVSTYTMPANTLATNGDHLTVNVCATHAANTNSTTLTLVLFGKSLAATSSASGAVACSTAFFTRVTSSTVSYVGYIEADSFNQLHGTATGQDFTTSNVIKYTVTAATTTNDLIGNYMSVDWMP